MLKTGILDHEGSSTHIPLGDYENENQHLISA